MIERLRQFVGLSLPPFELKRAPSAEAAFRVGADSAFMVEKLVDHFQPERSRWEQLSAEKGLPAGALKRSLSALEKSSYFQFQDALLLMLRDAHEFTTINLSPALSAIGINPPAGKLTRHDPAESLSAIRQKQGELERFNRGFLKAVRHFATYEAEAPKLVGHLWNVLLVAKSFGVPEPTYELNPLDEFRDCEDIEALIASGRLPKIAPPTPAIEPLKERALDVEGIALLLAGAAANGGRTVVRPDGLDDRSAKLIADTIFSAFDTGATEAFLCGKPVKVSTAEPFESTRQWIAGTLDLGRRELQGRLHQARLQ